MRRKIIGISLFLLGFAILAYPLVSRTYNDVVHRQEVEKIQQVFEETSEISAELYQQQINYNQGSVTLLEEIEIANVSYVETEIQNQEELTTTELYNRDIIGTLSIPAIDISYPIYDGASDEHLALGLARVEGTSYPVGGINTNSVISGHNGLTSRSYFSKLPNLVKGDLVYVQNRMEVIAYEVYATAIIEPDEVSALAIVPGQDTLTLLTCTGAPLGTHRYLVYARRVYSDAPMPMPVQTTASPPTTTTIEETTAQLTTRIVAGETTLATTEATTTATTEATTEATTIIGTTGETQTGTTPIDTGRDFRETALIFVNRYGLLTLLGIAALFAVYFIFIREKES